MKTVFKSIPPLFLLWSLCGCSAIGDKTASLSIIYEVAAGMSLLLLITCCVLVHQKKTWFVLLFSSVLVVNIGYTFLSLSTCLEAALWANRVAYLGSVFLPPAMLMIILNATNTAYSKRLPTALFLIALLVFLITASPGFSGIYYKDVSFAVVNGVSTLVKVYGPLHPFYLVYLIGFFSAMVATIVRARIKHTIDSTAHAVVLAIAVFVNIGVWFIEQLVSIDFEFLSISYIISELFLLGVHLVMTENQRLRSIVKQVETVPLSPISTVDSAENTPCEHAFEVVSPQKLETFTQGLARLTPTEQAVYNAYVAKRTTKEILADLNIKENTLKYHNRNLYGKLGVSSRKELYEIHCYIQSVKSKLDGINGSDHTIQ